MCRAVAWCGVAWRCVAWGVVWCGVAWPGVVWRDVVWRGLARGREGAGTGLVLCGVAWCGVAWPGKGRVQGCVSVLGFLQTCQGPRPYFIREELNNSQAAVCAVLHCEQRLLVLQTTTQGLRSGGGVDWGRGQHSCTFKCLCLC